MISEFYKTNIQNKLHLLQQEHKKVLRLLYEDAEKNITVEKYEFKPYSGQAMSYKDMEDALEGIMAPYVLNTCLSDLESWGFALKTKQVSAFDYAGFGITYLGLKYIEYEDTSCK